MNKYLFYLYILYYHFYSGAIYICVPTSKDISCNVSYDLFDISKIFYYKI